MTSTVLVGIDPGKAGGFAIQHGDASPELVRMPATERDTLEVLAEVKGATEWTPFAFVERLHCNGRNGSKSNWVLSASYHGLRMALLALEIPFEEFTPQAWQKPYGLLRKTKTETDTQKKNRHKARAQELFPGLKITHATADALLILEHGRRIRQGTR